ncbi:unnamed protein product [Linum trigynum]|uniref:Uncharacterized protein n=1 Tax=Linum trigynum TaxID=586398 RepID=A0AAV2EU87_9ROSI
MARQVEALARLATAGARKDDGRGEALLAPPTDQEDTPAARRCASPSPAEEEIRKMPMADLHSEGNSDQVVQRRTSSIGRDKLTVEGSSPRCHWGNKPSSGKERRRSTSGSFLTLRQS